MRAVDTSVVVRYLTGDEPQQTARARALIGQIPVFVPKTVLLEAEWVLRAVYDMPAARIIHALRALAGLPRVSVEDAALVAKALDWAERGMDFADALHLSGASGCERFLTFDSKLARAAPKLGGIPVAAP